MKIDKLDKELQQKVKALLDGAEDKSAAIYEAAEMIIEAKHKDLIEELVEQNSKAAADEAYRESLGLHALSKEENKALKNIVINKFNANGGKDVLN